MKGLESVFDEVEAPNTFTESQVFDSDDQLRWDVFVNARSHLKDDSSPGFPFPECQTNDEVDDYELYDAVNQTLLRWRDYDWVLPSQSSDETRDDYFYRLFILGLVPPSRMFVKGEPTKKGKVARLIFGVSIIMNVVGRILFADFLNYIKTTWDNATHKVGLDFQTEEGLLRLTHYFTAMLTRCQQEGRVLVSDDIQGWEYQGRRWMHYCFHGIYLRRCEATPFHRKMQTMYAAVEAHTMVMDSDFYLHVLPFFIIQSGRILTHLQNSFERYALACMDFECYGRAGGSTNGDDCLASAPIGFDVTTVASSRIGFVHTDVSLQTSILNFCSQIFYRSSAGSPFTRFPDGLAKMFYNYLAAPPGSRDVLEGIEVNLIFPEVIQLFRLSRELTFTDEATLGLLVDRCD